MNLAQTRHVTTERRTRLAKELSVELVRVAQRREHSALIGVLHSDLPSIAEHPARAVVVIVGVQGAQQTEQEHLVVVALAEVCILVDLGANGSRATGDDEDAAVEVGLRADLEVVALEVEAGDEVGEGAPQAAGGVAQDLLVGADEADLGVVKGREERLEEAGAPEGGVVNADGDGGRVLVEAVAGAQDLAALVGLIKLDDDEIGMGKTGGEVLDAQDLLDVLFELDTDGRDDEQLGGVDQDGFAAAQEGSRVGSNGGDDDGDIAVGISGWLANGATSRLVEVVASDEVDNESQVAKQEEEDEEVVGASELGDDAIRDGEEEQRRRLVCHGEGFQLSFED